MTGGDNLSDLRCARNTLRTVCCICCKLLAYCGRTVPRLCQYEVSKLPISHVKSPIPEGCFTHPWLDYKTFSVSWWGAVEVIANRGHRMCAQQCSHYTTSQASRGHSLARKYHRVIPWHRCYRMVHDQQAYTTPRTYHIHERKYT